MFNDKAFRNQFLCRYENWFIANAFEITSLKEAMMANFFIRNQFMYLPWDCAGDNRPSEASAKAKWKWWSVNDVREPDRNTGNSVKVKFN